MTRKYKRGDRVHVDYKDDEMSSYRGPGVFERYVTRRDPDWGCYPTGHCVVIIPAQTPYKPCPTCHGLVKQSLCCFPLEDVKRVGGYFNLVCKEVCHVES